MSPGFGMLPHRALAAALLGLVGPGLAAEERWLEVRSAHFQVVANTGAREARRAARRLERFHAAVHRLVPGDEARGVPLTTVLLFKDTASLGPLFPVYQGKRRPIGGLFARGHRDDTRRPASRRRNLSPTVGGDPFRAAAYDLRASREHVRL